jgi:WD40 repeat protein
MLTLLEAMKSNPARGWEWDYWNRMAHLEVGTFPKGIATTWFITYAPNGKLYARAEGRIWEYSPDTGQMVDLLPMMMGQDVATLVPFADGKRLLEYDGNQGQVIDLPNRRRLAKLEDLDTWELMVSISSDGRWVAGGRLSEYLNSNKCNRSAVLWNTESGEAVSLPTAPVRGVALSPDGKMIAAAELDAGGGASNFRAVVREFGTWKILASFETIGPAELVRFSPKSDRLSASTLTGWVQLWDLKTRREIGRTRATEGKVVYLEFSSDGEWLATGSVDRLGRMYDVSGSRMKLLETFRDAMSLSISPDKSRVAASYYGSTGGTLHLYDPKTYVETPTVSNGLESVDQETVLARRAPALVRSGSRAYELDPVTGEARELTWLPGKPISLPGSGESWGLVQRNDGALEIMDFDARRSVLALPKGTRIPFAIRQFPDGRRAVLLYTDKTLEVWDALEGHLLKQLRWLVAPYTAKVSPDGRWLAVALRGTALSVWDTTTWTERRFPHAGGNVMSITFSPDGTKLVAATENDNAELWDVRSGQLVGKLIGHSNTVEDAAYSPDGKRIVTASDDGTVRIWDAATLRELSSLAGHKRTVLRARFTDDGSSIVSIDDQGNAKMWLTRTPPGLRSPAFPAPK